MITNYCCTEEVGHLVFFSFLSFFFSFFFLLFFRRQSERRIGDFLSNCSSPTCLGCFPNLHGYLGHCPVGLGYLDLFFSLVTLVILLFIRGACLMLISPSTSCCLQLCALESRALSKDHIGGLKLNY